MAFLLKFLSAFMMCAIFFGKVGVPATILLFDYSFVKIFCFSLTAGICGNIAFTYMSAAILRAIHNYRVRKHRIHSRKIFTPRNRQIIRIKNRFGLTGIAFISPMFLSIPLGTFIAERFFRDKKKIILYFTISEMFWVNILFLLFDKVKGWLV
jgi:hypothetical protein